MKYDWEEQARKLDGENTGYLVCIGYIYADVEFGEGAIVLKSDVAIDGLFAADVLQDVVGDARRLYSYAKRKAL